MVRIKLMTPVLWLSFLIVFLVKLLEANSFCQTNQHLPLQMTITLKNTWTPMSDAFTSFYSLTNYFSATLEVEIKNITTTNQSFNMWSCSYAKNWKTDNQNVSLHYRHLFCAENAPVDHELEPGQCYKFEMVWMAHVEVSTNHLAFRLGFAPNRWSFRERGSIYNRANEGKEFSKENSTADELSKTTYWSNEMTVKIDQR